MRGPDTLSLEKNRITQRVKCLLNGNCLEDLILLGALGVGFVLWFVGLYERSKGRKMNREWSV